jgi:hypothetical protein
MLSYERIKAVEESLGPQAPPVIAILQELDTRIEQQKTEVKKDLFVELATKADIERLGGDIKRLEGATKADIATLSGDIKRLEERFTGEIKRLAMLVKVLIGLTIVAIALFSPAAAELVKLLR